MDAGDFSLKNLMRLAWISEPEYRAPTISQPVDVIAAGLQCAILTFAGKPCRKAVFACDAPAHVARFRAYMATRIDSVGDAYRFSFIGPLRSDFVGYLLPCSCIFGGEDWHIYLLLM